MVRAWLLVLFALGLGALGAWALQGDAGYALLNYGPWVVETSLLGLLLAAAALLFGLGALLRLIGATLRLPTTLREFVDRRRQDRARDGFETGLLRLMQGQWKRAEIDLVRRAADHRLAQLNYLGAARAAQRLGAGERRDHYLQLAEQHGAGDPAILITRAELQLERGDFAAARDAAQRLQAQDARNPYAAELLARALAGAGDWEALRRLLLETAKSAALDRALHDGLMQQATLALIDAAVASQQLDRLKALWDASPADLRRLPALRVRYAQALHRLNADADAAALIAETLRHGWDDALVPLYGDLQGNDSIGRLAAIEQWLGDYGERAPLLLTAGRVCLQNKLWGKARSYLEAAARLEPSPLAYRELARLCEQTQNPDEAARYYRLGLELAT